MIIPSKFNGYTRDGVRRLYLGGGGGGGPTTTTVQNTNLPEYAKPYVETMLGATQNQLFNTTQMPAVGDAGAYTRIDSFKPYQAYGGEYDAQGNIKLGPDGKPLYDPSKGIAGINDMQKMAYAGMANTAAPTAGYNLANAAIEDAGRGAGISATAAYNYGQQGQDYGHAGARAGTQGGAQYGKQGQDYGTAGARLGIQAGGNYGQQGMDAGLAGGRMGSLAVQDAYNRANAATLTANNYGQQGQDYGHAGARAGTQGGAQYGNMGANFGSQAAGLSNQALGYGQAGSSSGQIGQQLALDAANRYGAMGSGYGSQAAALAPQAQQYGQGAADIGRMGLRAETLGQDITGQARGYAAQAAGAGQQYANQATNPNAMKSYMSPYTQNVVDVQNQAAQRQADIARTQRGAQAARAGAFGGARQAIENAEADRALQSLMNSNQAQGLQSAYQQAQQAQQFGAGLNLQGLQGAQQGLGTALQGGQLGLSGIGQAMAGQQAGISGLNQAGNLYGLGMQGAGMGLQAAQTGLQGTAQGMQGAQAGLSGVNAANQAYQTGIQGAGMGLQGVNAQLAGTAQGMQGSQIGLSAADRALAAGQLAQQGYNTGLAGTGQIMQGAQVGLSGVDRQLAGTAQGMEGSKVGLAGVDRQLAGTAQGMQGSQIGLQGVNAAQAGYGLLGQQGMNLNNSLSQQQQNNINLNNAKMTMGNQEMAYQQSIKNQAIQDYANAQQYPMMQLGSMSNMLRGLPMQATTTQQYQAQPSMASQLIGAAGAGANIINATKAEGGVIKGHAKGGIMSYDMGGEIESQLESMDEKNLMTQAKESSSPSIRKIAQRLLRERQMSRQPQSPDTTGVQYQAAGVPSYKPGGIIAFTRGEEVPNPGLENNVYNENPEDKARLLPLAPASIMGAAPPAPAMQAAPVAQAAPAAPAEPPLDIVQEATRQRDIYSKQANRPTAEIIKEIQAERDALGVGDNKAREGYRSEQMAERANMKDEQERQRSLRLASFFAQWGSTPGPVLVAGMNALKNSIPDIISDEKEAKKARKEADKIIYDIDEATRLEKLGLFDKAAAVKQQAAKTAEEYNQNLLKFESQRKTDIRAKEVAGMQVDASKYATEKQLEGTKYSSDARTRESGAATSQRAEELRFANIDRALQIARGKLMDVEKDVANTMAKPPPKSALDLAMKSVQSYKNQLEAKKGVVGDVPVYMRKDAEQAEEVIKQYQTTAKRRIEEARRQVQTYEELFTSQGRGAKLDKTATPNKDDPLDLGDLLKEAPPTKAAAPASELAKPVNKPSRALAEVPTNSLPSNPYRQVSRGRVATDQAALQKDLEEYNSLKDSKLSLAAGRRSFLEKKLRAAGALEE